MKVSSNKQTANTGKSLGEKRRYLPFLLYIAGVAFLFASFMTPGEGKIVNELVILLDRSGSVRFDKPRETPPALRKISTRADKLHIIDFAAKARLSEAKKLPEFFPALKQDTLGASRTNYGKALQIAAGIKRSSPTRRRIILLGDGRGVSDHAIKDISQLAKSYVVETIGMGASPQTDAKLLSFSASQDSKAGAIACNITASCTPPQKCRITISDSSGKALGEKTRKLTPAGTDFTINIPAQTRGLHILHATVTTEGDEVEANNSARAAILARDKQQALWIGQAPPENIKEAASNPKWSNSERITGNIINKYQLLIMNNVSTSQLPVGFTGSLDRFIREGGALLTFCGKNVSGYRGYSNQTSDAPAMEELLPVKLTPHDGIALIFALDTSGSMAEKIGADANSPDKLSQAKSAIMEAWKRLDENDSAGVIAFSESAREIIAISKANTDSTPHHKALEEKLQDIHPHRGTSIFAGLELALKNLAPVRARRKHIILITDGDTTERAEELDAKLKQFEEESVTQKTGLSVIALGKTPNLNLLLSLSSIGKTRITKAGEKVLLLPEILEREISQSRELVRKNATVGKVTPHPATRGMSAGIMPQIDEHILCGAAKKDSDILIETTTGEILAACARRGMGRTLIVLGRPWNEWNWHAEAPQLVQNARKWLLDNKNVAATQIAINDNKELVFSMKREAMGNFKAVLTPLNAPGAPLENTAKAITLALIPQGESVWKSPLASLREGVYRAEIISQPGAHQLVELPLVVEDRDEYLALGVDSSALQRLATAGSGRLIQSRSNITPWENIPITGKRPNSASALLSAIGILLIILGLGVKAISNRY